MPERIRATTASTSHPTARTLLATKVRRALGLRGSFTLQHDETPTRVVVWSLHELQDVYARVGGTLALAAVTRATSDGTQYDVIETTLTTQLPGLATAEITTDWDPTTELDGYGLPVIRDYATAGARRG
ncbi:hypothetical protein R1T08_17255 [Streptomyces sp. SBC-4]|nr:hypothetical protein [Streptomyces sp. SBC-4]MDV5145909.1 hypothetical protein [Streptomyces sp. SBC-4]